MNIIPYPRKYVKIVGTFALNTDSKVYCDVSLKNEVRRFERLVEDSCGLKLNFVDDISLASVIFQFNDSCAVEGYYLMISQGVLTVSCADSAGCFYAIETLRQIFHLDFNHDELVCDNCYIEDEPRYVYRGLLVDVCRHFFSIDVMKQIVDLMSQNKLNKLHWHLTDDQGFRLQIDKYPRLNSVGSYRQGSEVLENGKTYVDEVEHGGFYTKDEVRDLVNYAAERHVDIVPEIDIPGHFVAALAAYPEYSCTGIILEVRKKWGISKDILCAGNEETYTFVNDILDEVCELFPSNLIHLGGDEAPKDRWCNCKLCREKMAEEKLADFEELQTYMVEQFRNYLEQKGKTVICWNDGVTKSTSSEIISQVWKPFTYKKGVKDVNKGRRTIMSPFFRMYFDYPYAMTPLSKTRLFNPCKGVNNKSQDNILGVEGTVWTERIADTDKLFFNLLPRLDALAECAWGSQLKDFKKRVTAKYAIYDKLNLNYNMNATKPIVGRACIVKKFFKNDPNIEINKGKK